MATPLEESRPPAPGGVEKRSLGVQRIRLDQHALEIQFAEELSLLRSLAATRTSGFGRRTRSCTRTLTGTPTATERLCFLSCAQW